MDLTACPMPPTAHQLTAIGKIVAEPPYTFLCDEMGMGKSKSVIDSASLLCSMGRIDRVIVIAPSSVKPVWLDQELGQLATHCWPTISNRITHYHRTTALKKRRHEWFTGHGPVGLHWLVSNYEFIRRGFKRGSRYIPPHLETLLSLCTDRTLLVLDESSAVKTSRALQTRACMHLRRACGRVVLMTGTPIAHSPMDLLSQANLLHPSILSDIHGTTTNIIQFRSRYCDMGGFQGRQILRFRNLEDLQDRLKPHTLRRLKKDCLDLPKKLDPVTITTTLSAASWKTYKEMRDHMIVELGGSVSVAQQAVTKLIRLSQLTSGMIGGIEGSPDVIHILSHEKIDTLTAWVTEQIEADPCFKLVIWTMFRADVERVYNALRDLPISTGDPPALRDIGVLWGQSKPKERDHALRLLHPSTAPEGAAIVVGTPATGSMGITLAASHTVLYMNNSHSLNIRVQSEDRTHRPGTTHAVSYFDLVCEGPAGQKTIDHIVLRALRQKRDLAEWTASAWLDALKETR